MNKAAVQPRKRGVYLGVGVTALGLLCWLTAGIFTVEPGEVAVLLRFGRVIADDLSAGLHYALPFPFHEVRKISLTRMQTLLIGAEPGKTRWITGDLNVVNATVQVNYRVANPRDALFGIESGPNQLVACAVSAAMSQTLSRFAVDDALTSQKIALENQVKAIAQVILDRHQAGIQILVTHIPEIAPPQEVAAAFREVLDAKAAQSQQITEAKISADLKRSDAATTAFEMRKVAESVAEERLKTAQARSQSLLALLRSPHREALKQKFRLQAVASVFGRSRKILVTPEHEAQVTIIK